jgi:Ser/Thr protein kinase RdoA (MazF antagonist)
LQRLSEQIGPEARPVDGMIHGDLHEGQLLVRDGAVVGVLDLDTVGRGRRADDAANALAHLASTIASAPPTVMSPGLSATLGFAEMLLRAADTRHHAVDLRRRTAAALLGLAAAQFQSQHPAWPERVRERISAAEAWMASATRMRTADGARQ